MNKKIVLTLMCLVLTPGICFAVSDNANTNSNGNANSNQTGSVSSTSLDQSVSSSTTQTTTQTTQIQASSDSTSNTAEITVEEREKLQTQALKRIRSNYEPKNTKSLERRSTVANAAQELVKSSYQIENKGIGDKIRLIAQAQNDKQDKINESIDKAEKRSKAKKFLVGPNFKELKEAKKLMKDNIAEIKDLRATLGEVTEEGERVVLLEQIVALHEKNVDLRDQIETIDDGFSLFGWLNKWIARY